MGAVELIITIIVSAILLGGSFAGGAAIGYNLKPATNITYQYITQNQNQDVKNTSIQNVMQGQISVKVIDSNRIDSVNLNISGLTNVSIDRRSNSNYTEKTNGR